MKFISAEEFLKQDKKVQETFINWWEPSIGDLYLNTPGNREDFEQIVEVIYSQELANDAYNNKNCNMKESRGDYFPLLTEGQLRKFIEDKTKYKIVYNYNYEGNIIVGLKDIKSYGFIKEYKTDEADLLQAYWQVAVEIASKEVKEQ